MKTRVIWHFHSHQEYAGDSTTVLNVPCECPWAEVDNPNLLLCMIGDRWWWAWA